jgi:hypothetical protein
MDDQPTDMEDTLLPYRPNPNSTTSPSEETQWQQARLSKRRPLATPDDSPASNDYVKCVVSLRLALQSASPTSRHHFAEEYAAVLAEDPLLLPTSGGEMQRHDLASTSPLLPRPANSMPHQPRPPPSESAAADISLDDIPRRSTPAEPPEFSHSVGGKLG